MLSSVSLICATAFLGFTAAVGHSTQLPLLISDSVPGFNNVTFCTVPAHEQLFHIQIFDIAPQTIPVEQIFFTYLRGWLPQNVTRLEEAKLQVTLSADLASGEPLGPFVYSIPLSTFGRDNVAHLTIRYPGNKFGGPMQPGVNEIVTDYWIPEMFLKAGEYTFKIEAILPGKEKEEDDKYLFAFQLTQWLDPKTGRPPRRASQSGGMTG